MPLTSEKLRFTLGLKLKKLRQQAGLSLRELSAQAGLSISYLSEIEKGKKYPKPEKLLDLATALGTEFDDLVSMRVGEELNPVTSLFNSDFVQEFPFDLFGVAAEDLVGLVTDEPRKAGALVGAFLEIGRTYDVRVEQFLFAALRAYQKLNVNYFVELEEAAQAFRREHGLDTAAVPMESMAEIYRRLCGVPIDETALSTNPELSRFRSVLRKGDEPTLFINERLLPSQKAFVLGREVAYHYLGLEEHAVSSSWLKVESFEQVLNNFKASYFAGAVLLDRERLREDLESFRRRERWDRQAFFDAMAKYDATPEIFFYRLAQLLPHLYGTENFFFMRFNHGPGEEPYALTKLLNLSKVAVPHAVGLGEAYCRRWPAFSLLRRLAEAGAGSEPPVNARRLRFLDAGAEFLVVSIARPLALTEGTNTCVSLGLLVDDDLKRALHFVDDPAIERIDVNLTCERCSLTAAECSDRAAPANVVGSRRSTERREAALQELLRGPSPKSEGIE